MRRVIAFTLFLGFIMWVSARFPSLLLGVGFDRLYVVCVAFYLYGIVTDHFLDRVE